MDLNNQSKNALGEKDAEAIENYKLVKKELAKDTGNALLFFFVGIPVFLFIIAFILVSSVG